jgi:RimJ/RimL family protein N-acetyltransferase
MIATSISPEPITESTALQLVFPERGLRVTLRRLQPSDLRVFQAYRHDARLGRYQGWTATSDDDALKFLCDASAAQRFALDDWVQIGIAKSDTHTLIGDIGIHLSADCATAEIGFTLQREAHGSGLATDAVRQVIKMVFAQTPAVVIVGVTDARNAASMRLLRRVGMTLQSSANTVFRGEACVEHTYSIDRKDYVEVGA